LNVHQAVALVERICDVAGSRDLISEARSSLSKSGVIGAVQERNTATIFDWLMEALSYQGVSDRVAEAYMEDHGVITHQAIANALAEEPSCPKLESYWQFSECGFRKNQRRCSRQDLIHSCPLPRHDLRNGILNQMAYSLFLFLRDICDGDFVDWIDRQLGQAKAERVDAGYAIIEPMRHIYGVSWKVLSMALATLLLGASDERLHWKEVGGELIAIDTLVHAWLHRTGILRGQNAEHLYGPACYNENGCAEIVHRIASEIDARKFNRSYPSFFPRFVQHAIWRFCAQQQLNQCNGNKLDDTKRCNRFSCIIHDQCGRLALNPSRPSRAI
jgi:hypothetical protein